MVYRHKSNGLRLSIQRKIMKAGLPNGWDTSTEPEKNSASLRARLGKAQKIRKKYRSNRPNRNFLSHRRSRIAIGFRCPTAYNLKVSE